MKHLLLKHIPFLIIMILIASCALPIPHKRLHAYGIKSKIVDNKTNMPVQNAFIYSTYEENDFVKSDDSGNFELPPVYGWHGGYFIGPVSTSFWPGFDIAAPVREIVIKAQGYLTMQVTVESYEQAEDDFILRNEIRIYK